MEGERVERERKIKFVSIGFGGFRGGEGNTYTFPSFVLL